MKHPASLNLIVIRSEDIERSAMFYRQLGLPMEPHSHAPCGEHFAAEFHGLVFEIYPKREKDCPSTGTTIGFIVESLEQTLADVEASEGVIRKPPHSTEFGRMAIVADPDGHTVIVTERT